MEGKRYLRSYLPNFLSLHRQNQISTKLNCLQLLLGYLPLERLQWPRFLQRKRAEYAHFCEVRAGVRGAWLLA